MLLMHPVHLRVLEDRSECLGLEKKFNLEQKNAKRFFLLSNQINQDAFLLLQLQRRKRLLGNDFYGGESCPGCFLIAGAV